jgi:predicted ATPase
MLRYLVTHAGRLVTKAEVQQQVWAGTHVTASVLRASVREIRAVLGDSATAPRYLATIGRQGYRFLGGDDLEGPPPRTAGPLVGRQDEVAALAGWWRRAAHGTRQLGFISGEAGVGKTTLVEMFLARVAAGSGVRTARGQCVEHAGEGEPYLPFLEALGRLGHGPERDAVRTVLRRYAPMWLAHLPGLVSEPELERLQSRLHGLTPARMLRELAEALEVLTADRALVLILEDLQWSDHATVEALAYLAQRPEPARLLLVGTYRPVEALLQEHCLRGRVQELCGRGHAVDLRLEFLSAADVAAYAAGRLGGPVAAPLTAFVYQRTDGNALFMVTIMEHLVQQGLVVRRAGQWTLREGPAAPVTRLPEGLAALLLRRIEALPPETRWVLEVASVVGEEFAVAAVAAGAQCPVEAVEAQCEAVAAQHHLLDDFGVTVWPDATRSGWYRFQHALYQQVLYESLGTVRRLQLHQRIGARLEAGYGARAGEIAAQLAVHFERAGEVQRAVHAWRQIGDTAARRHAYQDAIAAVTKGLALLATLPDSPQRTEEELTLQLTLGELLMAVKGPPAPEVGEVYVRAQRLCDQLGETPQRIRMLQSLFRVYQAQAQVPAAGVLAQQLTALAQRQRDAGLMLEAQSAVGTIALFRGDLAAARTHLEPCLSRGDLLPSSAPTYHGGHHLRVTQLVLMAQLLWGLGYAAQAEQRSQEALALAQQLEHPPSLAHAHFYATVVAQFRRDVAATAARADALLAFATAQGLGHRVAHGRILGGWALAMQGEAAAGVTQIRQGLAVQDVVGPKMGRAYFLGLLAEASGQAAQPEAGLTVLADACTLVAETEARWWEAELYRLQGALLLQRPRPEVDQAEARFQQALDVARRQQARALELRAALSLTRLWQQHGQRSAARELLAPLYDWFTEGLDTADLQAAHALLDALA